jgi:DNA modification methylase
MESTGLPIFASNMLLPRHRWYEFKEGFSEDLVQLAVTEFYERTGKIPRLLDPFMGSGTTLITSGKLGLAATGIEVNPFISFSARAKCSNPSSRRNLLIRKLNVILADSKNEIPSPLEGLSTFSEAKGLTKWLFNRSVLRGFTAIDRAIMSRHSAHDPFRLALISALMDCCNAKRDGKCLRYKEQWEKLGFDSSDLRDAFKRRVDIVIEDLVEYRFCPSNLRAIRGDARAKLRHLRAQSYDLVVTSPPYLNSFDYSDVYRPEAFAGGFVRTNAQLRSIRLKTIRSHVQVDWKADRSDMSRAVSRLVAKISERELWNRKLPDMVRSYFSDISSVLSGLWRVVRPNGEVWMVVATSSYAGVHVEVDKLIAQLARDCGWSLRGIETLRQIRGSGQQWAAIASGKRLPLRESLIVLERSTSAPVFMS